MRHSKYMFQKLLQTFLTKTDTLTLRLIGYKQILVYTIYNKNDELTTYIISNTYTALPQTKVPKTNFTNIKTLWQLPNNHNIATNLSITTSNQITSPNIDRVHTYNIDKMQKLYRIHINIFSKSLLRATNFSYG